MGGRRVILCAGESLIDMIPQGGGFRPLPGGSVYNTAIALGRLGVGTSYLWPISRDPFGQMLLAPLQQAGVDITLCPRTDRLTTLAFVTLENGEARYSFYDEGSAGRMFAPQDLPPLPPATSALFVGGISLVPDPCGATIEKLVEQARARSVPVMLDPNIRPFFIRDESGFRDRLTRLISRADIVKLSADDLDWLHPQGGQRAIARIQDLGPRIILQTGGDEGATAHWQGQAIAARAVKVAVADTIGAGDTFNAGVLAALSQKGALARGLDAIDRDILGTALDLGTRAAAITVSRPGANPPWSYELSPA